MRRLALRAAQLALMVAASYQGAEAYTPFAAQQEVRSFDISARPLAEALIVFGKQAGIQVLTAGTATDHLRSSAIRGALTPSAALQQILAGSGLEAHFTDPHTVVISHGNGHAKADGLQAAPAITVKPMEAAHVAKDLDKVTVLGSLIPRAEIETASAVVVISAEELHNRGFATVADALQQSSFATAATANRASQDGQIWGAKTIGMFGLDPSFTKYLVDGRPMAGFSQPAINSNSTTLVNNLTTIPIDMVERIEILPGSQSSLYGSDAVAGVINIVTKKDFKSATLDARYGWYTGGGGRDRKISFSDMIHAGRFKLSFGLQLAGTEPISANQRALTAQNFATGVKPQVATPLVSAFSLFTGQDALLSPVGCGALSKLWGGTLTTAGGDASPYCGSVKGNSYSMLTNQDHSASVDAHASFDFSPRLQLYSDLLATYEEQSRQSLPFWSGTIFDPGSQNLYLVTRDFSPEEVGGDGYMKQYETNVSWATGIKGGFGDGWNYDLSLNMGLDRVTIRQGGILGDSAPGSYGGLVTGSGNADGNPNYALLYTPLTPAQLAQYVGYGSIQAHTDDDVARAMLTQTSLFSLPAGDVGFAAVMEGGYQGWNYNADPLLTSGEIGNLNIQPSHGHRTRWATAAELNVPLLKTLTMDMSGRYDQYDSEGKVFGDFTYSAGLEFRPIDTLLFRAKYSTAFKAPTLVDQFQAGISDQEPVIDYANCMTLAHSIDNCPVQYQNITAQVNHVGNPGLKPITTRGFSYGVVWSPSPDFSVNVDYQQLVIHNEVLTESANYVLRTEQECDDGTLNSNSPSCVAARGQVVRAPAVPGSGLLGNIISVSPTKINLAKEFNNSLTAGLNYHLGLHQWGDLSFTSAYTLVLKHQQQTFPGDPTLDLLANPYQQQAVEFKSKANASLTWSKGPWTATFYTVYYGRTPNYAALSSPEGYAAEYGGKLAPWVISNISVSYQATHRLNLSFQVNNIKNSMPPYDATQNPGLNEPYNLGNYNVFGREFFVEAKYQFGTGSGH